MMGDVPHIGYIVGAYAVAALVLLSMIGAVWLDHRSLSSQLEALEKRRGGKP